MRNKLFKASLLLLSFFISLLFCETLLRIIDIDQFYIWPPNLKQYFLPEASIFSGIRDTSLFKINSLGFRGGEFSDSDAINIITIGGSTTECLYLDQSETWPARLEQYLNRNTSNKFRVFNGGRSGLNSQHHIIQVQQLLEHYKWIDVIIVLEGFNDLQYALSLGDNYKKEDYQTSYDRAFLLAPLNDKLSFYKRSYLFMELRRLKRTMMSYNLGGDPKGYSYIQWRNNRLNALEIVDTSPALERSLSDFQYNTTTMINLAKAKNKRIIFLTQPVAWDKNMSLAQNKLCWFGWIGKSQTENTRRYYSISQLEQSIDKYNSVLKAVCRDKGIECIDLGSTLEKDTTTFYDDCHFNESGADKVAKIISIHLSAHNN